MFLFILQIEGLCSVRVHQLFLSIVIHAQSRLLRCKLSAQTQAFGLHADVHMVFVDPRGLGKMTKIKSFALSRLADAQSMNEAFINWSY